MLGDDPVHMEDWIRYSMLRNGQEQLTLFLTLNYRGHPSFLMIPSALFYADKLHAYDSENKKRDSFWCQMLRQVEALSSPVIDTSIGDSSEAVRPQKEFDWPIHFRSVVGKDVAIPVNSGFSGNSWANRMEAETATEIAFTLVSNGVSTQSIGVLSPFRGQVVMIRDLLRQRELGAVNVGTVEDYQAVEKEVIVLSLTRSSNLFVQHDIANRMGMFGQPKRSNVAMTRAECLFIVVSDKRVATCLTSLLCFPDRKPNDNGVGLCMASVPFVLPAQWAALWACS
jgi:superfamily I DNA and/or RNA helicase